MVALKGMSSRKVDFSPLCRYGHPCRFVPITGWEDFTKLPCTCCPAPAALPSPMQYKQPVTQYSSTHRTMDTFNTFVYSVEWTRAQGTSEAA